MTPRHLVAVAGHAVLVDARDPLDAACWSLLPYQTEQPAYYVEHVRAGVTLAAADPAAVLVFSGGQTRLEAGPRSEAQGYYGIAEHFGWWGQAAVAGRCTTEEFARDSFENLLFSICRFREWTGSYPEHVSFVTWAFKRERFGLHRDAMGWPAERFTFIGPNDPPDLAPALESEERAREAYAADPYSSGAAFVAKRAERNPHRRQNGYASSCPELAALLLHAGPERFDGVLPWTRGGSR